MNYDGVILENAMLVTNLEKKTFNVYIDRIIPLELERETIVSPVHIIPLFPDFRDENGEYGAGKIKNVFEAILPFGDGQMPPRRTPLEIPWTRVRS